MELRTKSSRLQLEPKDGNQWLSLELCTESGKKFLLVETPPGGRRFSYGSFLMFPWVNRLRPNPWERMAKDISTAWVEDSHGISLHGMVHSLPREPLSLSGSAASFLVKIPEKWRNEHNFAYEIEEGFRLTEHRLEITYKVWNSKNSSESFALGIHPYFRLGEEDWELDLGKAKEVLLDKDLLPKEILGEAFGSLPVLHRNWDSLFYVTGTPSVRLVSSERNVQLKIGSDQAKFFQIYLPPESDRIAIEPMTSCANFLTYPLGNPKNLLDANPFIADFRIEMRDL